MPSFFAISAMSFTVSVPPTSCWSWANTVLTDCAVASRSVMGCPKPSPSSALAIGVQLVRQLGGTYSRTAGYTLVGGIPLAKAVASVKGLNDDPACRPPPPPVRVLPSQQVAATTIFFGSKRDLSGQPPRAKLVDA